LEVGFLLSEMGSLGIFLSYFYLDVFEEKREKDIFRNYLCRDTSSELWISNHILVVQYESA
jgi:hypothetical protein